VPSRDGLPTIGRDELRLAGRVSFGTNALGATISPNYLVVVFIENYTRKRQPLYASITILYGYQ
jgi:hypothetical protein